MSERLIDQAFKKCYCCRRWLFQALISHTIASFLCISKSLIKSGEINLLLNFNCISFNIRAEHLFGFLILWRTDSSKFSMTILFFITQATSCTSTGLNFDPVVNLTVPNGKEVFSDGFCKMGIFADDMVLRNLHIDINKLESNLYLALSRVQGCAAEYKLTFNVSKSITFFY